MNAATSSEPMVRIFAPDGDGGYIQWGTLSETDRQERRERIHGTVRRAWNLKHSALAADEHKAEVSNRVRELIDWLREDT